MPFKYVIIPPSEGEYEPEGVPLTRPFRQFLYNRLRDGLDLSALNLRRGYDPLLMEGMEEAVERVKRAIRRGERILIHGDYDTDGLTALSLMFYALAWVGADVVPFVPDRFTDGYGLSRRGVIRARELGAKVILTVDCGVSSHREVAMAREMGIDVIITDHHQLPTDLPEAVVVHPNLGAYPYTGLTGVGVALKFAIALYEALGEDKGKLYHLLDLVAVGTVADVGSMLGENRLLVKHGLYLMNRGIESGGKIGNDGLLAVIRRSRAGYPVGAWHVSWLIAPRINAAGRMGRTDVALNLLLANRRERAMAWAEELERLNDQRKRKQEKVLQALRGRVNHSSPIVFVVSGDVDEGIAGIVAIRLMEEFGKPTAVVSVSDGVAKGSMRSIAPFNVYEALKSAEGLFSENENFGGHTLAGGFRIREEKLDDLRRALESYARSVSVNGEFVRTVKVDAHLKVEEMDHSFWEDMARFRPYGHGFPSPVFALRLKDRPTVLNGPTTYLEHYEKRRHFRLRVLNPPIAGEEVVVTNLRFKNGVVFGDVIGSL